MTTALRKNITISADENRIITDFCQKVGKSFSEVLRTATLKYIEAEEKKDLAKFLETNCKYVCAEEQEEFNKWYEALSENEKNDEGREIDINELLQDKI